MSTQQTHDRYEFMNDSQCKVIKSKEKELVRLVESIDRIEETIYKCYAYDFPKPCTLDNITDMFERQKLLTSISETKDLAPQEEKSDTKCELAETEVTTEQILSDKEHAQANVPKADLTLDERIEKTVNLFLNCDKQRMVRDNEVYVKAVSQIPAKTMEKMCVAKAECFNGDYGADIVCVATFSPTFLQGLHLKSFMKFMQSQVRIHHGVMHEYFIRYTRQVETYKRKFQATREECESIAATLDQWNMQDHKDDDRLKDLQEKLQLSLISSITKGQQVQVQLMQLQEQIGNMLNIRRCLTELSVSLLLEPFDFE